jgi:DNA-binding NtrC family response regulator
MPAKIIMVHDQTELISETVGEMSRAGHSIIAMSDPIDALDTLSGSKNAQLLITGVHFPSGKPHGISLARMAKVRCPDIKILFIAPPGAEQYIDDLGEFIPMPADMPTVTGAIARLLGPGERSAFRPA